MTDQSKETALESNVESPEEAKKDVLHTSEQESSRDSLGRFKKGCSGNPGGRSIEVGLSFPETLRKFLAEKSLDDVDQDELTIKEKIVLDWIKLVQAGNKESLKALDMLVNRLEGTPVATQKLDIQSVKSPYETLFGSEEDEDEG